MHDADQLKILTALGHAARLLEAGAVNVLTEGHLFRLNEGTAALARVEAILDQAETLNQKIDEVLPTGREPVDLATFTDRLMAAYSSLGAEGGNPNPIFVAGMALNALRELGMTPRQIHKPTRTGSASFDSVKETLTRNQRIDTTGTGCPRRRRHLEVGHDTEVPLEDRANVA
jgi:hypothetical protein